jgi:hypothetical protein
LDMSPQNCIIYGNINIQIVLQIEERTLTARESHADRCTGGKL